MEVVRTQEQTAMGSLSVAASEGDSAAFGRLYDLYVDRVYRYVYYHVGNTPDAEDVTEHIFLKALQSIDRFRCEKGPFIAWLQGIARNAVIDHLRTRKPLAPLDEDLADTGADTDPVSVADLHCTQAELHRAILALKPEHREVIVLRFVEELDHAQTAECVGKSEGAVRVIQHRALAALRQALVRQES